MQMRSVTHLMGGTVRTGKYAPVPFIRNAIQQNSSGIWDFMRSSGWTGRLRVYGKPENGLFRVSGEIEGRNLRM